MSAGEDRQTDGPHVLLHGRGDDLLRRLAKAGVDHLEARVAQRSRDHLGATVVAVQPGLGDENPVRSHGSGALGDQGAASRRSPYCSIFL